MLVFLVRAPAPSARHPMAADVLRMAAVGLMLVTSRA